MTILKTIDGKEINTDEFPGYGQFKEYVQKNIDPAYGKGDTKSTIYEVEMSATKIVNVYYTFEIDAPTKEQAKSKRLNRQGNLTHGIGTKAFTTKSKTLRWNRASY